MGGRESKGGVGGGVETPPDRGWAASQKTQAAHPGEVA